MKSTMLALAMFTSGCGGLPQLLQTLESLRTDCYGLLDRAQRAGLDASRAKELRVECDAATDDAKARVAWAKAALLNPGAEARRCMLVALAQNKANTVAQITNATDAALQSAVDSTVNLII